MPTAPKMFALTMSSGNVLVITKIFSSRYLNKYAAGKEEHAQVLLKAGTQSNTFAVDVGNIENDKITGVQLINSQNENNKRTSSAIQALSVSQTEFAWWTLQLPAIITCFDFVHVPSLALEFRG